MQKHVGRKPSVKICFVKTIFTFFCIVIRNCEVVFDFVCFASLVLISGC